MRSQALWHCFFAIVDYTSFSFIMKIRIAGSSIRFRLKQPEVKMFSQQQSITEIIEFGMSRPDQLRFVLKAANADQLSIAFDEHTITLNVPQQLINEWTTTDLVGFEETVKAKDGKTIKVLVEKDFACLDKGSEENKGTYPNPKAMC